MHRHFLPLPQIAQHRLCDVMQLRDRLTAEPIEPFDEVDHVVFVLARFVEIELVRKDLAGGSASCDAFDFDDLADPHAEAAWTAFYAEGLFERACEMVQPLVEDHTYRIFRRVYIDRQPPAAVASEFGVTRNMVYVAQCRCLTKVRGIIDRYLDDLP